MNRVPWNPATPKHLQKCCFSVKLRHFSQKRSLQQSHFRGRKHIGFLDSKKWSSPVVSPQQPFAVEICCGKASLSRSLIDAGFSVLAVLHDPQVPVTLLDLTQVQHQKILIDLLHNLFSNAFMAFVRSLQTFNRSRRAEL